jgi:hypothetical protein
MGGEHSPAAPVRAEACRGTAFGFPAAGDGAGVLRFSGELRLSAHGGCKTCGSPIGNSC